MKFNLSEGNVKNMNNTLDQERTQDTKGEKLQNLSDPFLKYSKMKIEGKGKRMGEKGSDEK